MLKQRTMLTTRRRADCAGVACEHTLGRQPLHLYGYLWAKPEFLVDDQSGRFSFVVPDTVLFKQQKPVKWFFTSRQEKGKILTKSKKNVSVTHVLQAFSEPKHETAGPRDHDKRGAAETADHDAIVATYVYPDRASNGEPIMVLEHLTPAGVQHLLSDREKPPISVLQRFIPTRSGYNHLIQSVFTPEGCLLRKCVNSNQVKDTKLCLPERTATFEADENLVKPRDVMNRELRDKIEHMHLEMSNHLKKIIGKPVARNVAYFKHGADDRIYLLWSTMLSFESGSLAFAKNMRLSLSHHDRLQHLIATTSSPRPHTDNNGRMTATYSQLKKCPGCRSSLPSHLVDFLATFKAIITAFEVESQLASISCVPPLLESILPPTSDERFMECCAQKEFLYRTVALCQPCAKRINSTIKPRPRTASPAMPPAHSTAHESDRDKPVYMQSAHSVFWGKVERDEAAREKIVRERILQSRPKSAISTKVSTKSFRASHSKILPNGLTRASLKRLLPDIAATSQSVIISEPKHCIQKLADHLRQTFGGPSVRLALSRTGIYPQMPEVSLDLLRWIADPGLLADVFAYWRQISISTEVDPARDSIDVDALDAMLATNADVTSLSSRSQSSLRHQVVIFPSSIATDSITREKTLIVRPAPPISRRPSSCRSIRPTSSRATRLASGLTTISTVPDRQTSVSGANTPHPDTMNQVSSAVLTRTIDGIECDLHVSTIVQRNDQSFNLRIRAIPVCNGIDARASTPMELTLNTHEILEMVSHQTQPIRGDVLMPTSGEELVKAVLDRLAIRNGRIIVHPAQSLPPARVARPSVGGSMPSAVTLNVSATDSCLTAEELHFLQETLHEG